jgi:hypothetical protein
MSKVLYNVNKSRKLNDEEHAAAMEAFTLTPPARVMLATPQPGITDKTFYALYVFVKSCGDPSPTGPQATGCLRC